MGETLNSTVEPRVFHTDLLSAEAYRHYWPHIEAQLETIPHVWKRWFDLEYLRDVPEHRELLVFGVGVNGAEQVLVFARFIHTPRGKGLQFVLALGNNLEECLPTMVGTLEQLANTYECDFAEIVGRPGWERKIPGFKRDYVIMTKQLRHFEVQ